MVEEFDMSDTTVEAECFGGTYKAKVYDNGENCRVGNVHNNLINLLLK